ncbi:uncharacterized protein LOC128226043 [Mya arenaria]|uniref:uncharacterized protein LOC128226043 n=1 Tax=Mya arenaria TaxID=6604 RepID=UPI0022DF69C0|nr:uncharacterized protein LOC128226043 [Mya arenaria]
MSILSLAIDFGTTYSGYAYSFKDKPDKISTNQRWAKHLTSLKTPTVLLLNQSKEFDSFGYEAEERYADLLLDESDEGWMLFRKFKMILYQNTKLDEKTTVQDLTKKKEMPALKIFSLSLKYLKDHALDNLNLERLCITEQDITFVVTVPAIWDDRARMFMREAAVEAGIPRNQLVMALESEAASVWCQRVPVAMDKSAFTQDNSRYMVVDLGGGTADITVHQKLRTGQLKQLCADFGGKWGGQEVDNNFIQLLTRCLGREAMNTFYDECLHDVSIAKDKLKIDAEIIKRMFVDCISKTIDAIKDKFKGDPRISDVKNVLVVGGFAECAIVQAEMKERLLKVKKKLVFPPEAGLAVLNGAVLFGHEPTIIASRKTKFTYGLKKKTDGKNTIHIFIEKEEEYSNGHVVTVNDWPLLDKKGGYATFELFMSTSKTPKFVTDPTCKNVGKLEMKVHNSCTACEVSLVFDTDAVMLRIKEPETGDKIRLRSFDQPPATKHCLQDFVFVLEECGYKRLAAKLYLSLFKLDAATSVNHVHKTTSGQRPLLSKMVVNLKKMVDDAQFTDPRLALSQLSDRFILKMRNESNDYRRQILADKCVAVIGAEIDAIAITFDKGLRERDVFTKMKSLTSETSNTLLTDGVYFGRLANANAIAGRFEESEDMLRAARCKAFHIGPCFELLFMIVIEVQVRLYSFEKMPTPEKRRALLMWGRMGLECAKEENLDGKTMWRRSFILRMVFCLLGLGNRANVIENCPVDDTCIVEAKELLADIDRNWTGIETRRKMFYYVARARIAELTKQYQDCLDNLRFSMNLALEGHFDEFGFISTYFDKVNSLTHLRSKHTGTIVGGEPETEVLDEIILDETRNYALIKNPSFNQSLDTISICTFDDDETIPKHRLYSPVAWNSTSRVALLQFRSDQDTHPSVEYQLRCEGDNTFQETRSQSVNFERENEIVLMKHRSLSFSDKSNSSFTNTRLTVFKPGISGRFCMESITTKLESYTDPKEIYYMQQMSASFEGESTSKFPKRKDGVKTEKCERLNVDEDILNYGHEHDYSIYQQEFQKPDAINQSNESKLSVRLPLSGRTSAGNSDADSLTKPKCLVSAGHTFSTQNHLRGEDPHVIETYDTFKTSELCMSNTEMEVRISPAGRDSAGNTPYQTKERSLGSQEGNQKDGHSNVEHLNVYQSFKESDLSDNLSSLDSDEMFGD